MTFFKVLVQYTGFLFFPHQLRVERDFAWAHSLFEWDVLAGGLLVGLMLYAAFKYGVPVRGSPLWHWLVFYCHCSNLQCACSH